MSEELYSTATPRLNQNVATSRSSAHIDALMTDEQAISNPNQSSFASPPTGLWRQVVSAEDTHGIQSPPETAPSFDQHGPATPVPEQRPTTMPALESFDPQDLAMENNPVTTRDIPLIDDSHTGNTGLPPPTQPTEPRTHHVPDHEQETSVTGWLAPPQAEEQPAASTPYKTQGTQTTKPSKISFDGAYSSLTSLHLLIPQFESAKFDIATFLQLCRVFPHLTFWDSDYLTLSEITFEWGDSYDDKDWMRLRAILAPTLMVDYTEVNGHKWDSMPAEDFVGIMSHIGFVGDPLVHTQHHIGASKWQKISEEEVIGHHQLRAAHQRYTALDRRVVENKGHGHAMVQHLYTKIAGEWKLSGLRPTVRWNEFEFEKIFKGI